MVFTEQNEKYDLFNLGKKTPLFDTKSIPAPENILATKTPYNNDFKLSGNTTI